MEKETLKEHRKRYVWDENDTEVQQRLAAIKKNDPKEPPKKDK